MTAAAVEPELTVVNVIGAMTIRTAAAESRLLCHRAPMTAFTTDVPMCTIENEAGLRIVIEPPLLPVDGVMAQRAVLDETAGVGIDFAVAIDAVFGRIAKYLGVVAGVAFRFRVRAEQRKPRQVVVEEHIFLPGVLGMTIETLRPLGALVRVIVFMT